MSDVLISTVEYGTGSGRPLTMHLLQAQPRPSGLAPALVWVHGGAFRHGSKDSGIAKLFPFARRGRYSGTEEVNHDGSVRRSRIAQADSGLREDAGA